MEIKKIDLDEVELNTSPSPSLAQPTIERKIQTSPMSKNNSLPIVILFLVVIGAGVLTGSWLKSRSAGGSSEKGTENVQADIPLSGAKVGDTYGSADEKAFRDKVLGVVDKGGVSGEGTHKLVRPGGASQTVCVSSTTIDLDLLVGHQVTLWGETFDGQKCGWLMDVGRARIENLNVPLPN
ncbi:MAG: hypothetical protein UW26_C0035G0005 [Candidatus Collierbacteria bacterium GW2011_GWF1_44_12]|uniref:Uncharacterized protein n=4 Tax=Candidatus Collieribacteriota TaxID=1752725 RepID=A0A0G1S5H1_9BACT|nr:MAG: hypothetical protein UW23_C0027G0005 [Candidatus Collierbacteria bacterium GW2011_GWA1_44_12]KKT37306.1 MAG: hypothetical protein UW26_C0035G0005 [Candidatus Collierbacteria bacterium GW2011_GWF1_44_12]KKT96603.1 MAG: hypothetical protein UW99_C0054G0004 [Candidatus Collierbacteria bacterium GW2011_GWC2_45_15]KKU28465.1 MAG: hypothetical protein UX41_C0034G0006 [Candidatus Collierbacteria bacterium GW2011_GWE1_46_18]